MFDLKRLDGLVVDATEAAEGARRDTDSEEMELEIKKRKDQPPRFIYECCSTIQFSGLPTMTWRREERR